MSHDTLTHIVPQLPPAINGLGDYATILGKALSERSGLRSRFIVCDRSVSGTENVVVVRERSAQALERALEDAHGPLVLHYSGYGYHSKGCPIWLADALENWIRRGKESRLIAIFHELEAWGPIWSSAFWLNSTQRSIIKRIANLSSAILTTREENGWKLARLTRGTTIPIVSLPVFSNVPERSTTISERPRRLVVFGTPGRRIEVYKRSLLSLEQAVRALRISHIDDIGSPIPLPIDTIAMAPIVQHGEQPLDAIRTLFDRALVGAIDYPASILAKSGIFAAYCSSGLAPLVVGSSSQPGCYDGLVAGKHYLSTTEDITIERVSHVAANAHSWYQGHNVHEHANAIEHAVNQTGKESVSRFRRPRALLVSQQPTQNARPLEWLSDYAPIDSRVFYCFLPQNSKSTGEEFLNRSVFDNLNLSGHRWITGRNASPKPGLGRFFGAIHPSIVEEVGKSDAVIVFGHNNMSFLLAIGTALLRRKPLVLSTDATSLESINPSHSVFSKGKRKLKKSILPFMYNMLARRVLVPSSASAEFLRSLGVRSERIAITPYAIDNDHFSLEASRSNVEQTRKRWNISIDSQVVLFCGKLIQRKNPEDLLEAFARLPRKDVHLVLIGDGPLRSQLESRTVELNLSDKVHFPGFVPYSELPACYAASTILVHPASHEPFGLVVNEAMACGIPVICSDNVGAAKDLIDEGVSGFTYPSGNQEALASRLLHVLSDASLRERVSVHAKRRLESWSSDANAKATAGVLHEILS